MMHRCFIDRIDGDTVAITDTGQLHHLKDVLRLKVGDAVVVCDGGGNEYSGAIVAIEKKQAVIKLTTPMPARQTGMKLTIACAIPKAGRMDDIVDELTQLGVASIIPMETERVVVKLDEAKKQARLQRWRKIARNAARQSRRNSIPLVEPVTDVTGVIGESGGFDLKLIPHLGEEGRPIKDVLTGAHPRDVIVLIGPEGDFTPEEVRLALEAGFLAVSLGDTVLRVATAAVAVAGYFRFAVGD